MSQSLQLFKLLLVPQSPEPSPSQSWPIDTSAHFRYVLSIPAGQVSSRIRHLPHAPKLLSQAEQSCGGGGEGGGGDGDPTTYMCQLGWSLVIALQQRQPHPAFPTPSSEGYMNIVHGGFWAMAKGTHS